MTAVAIGIYSVVPVVDVVMSSCGGTDPPLVVAEEDIALGNDDGILLLVIVGP